MRFVFACLLLFAGGIYWMLFGPSEAQDIERELNPAGCALHASC